MEDPKDTAGGKKLHLWTEQILCNFDNQWFLGSLIFRVQIVTDNCRFL